MLLDPSDQAVHVGMKVRIRPDRERVVVREWLQRCRQVLFARQRRALNENWNHRNRSLQGGLDLYPDEVARIVDTATRLGPGTCRPLRADDGQQQLAVGHRIRKPLPEIDAERYGVDILEDTVRAEVLYQTIINAAGDIARLAATVRKEDQP